VSLPSAAAQPQVIAEGYAGGVPAAPVETWWLRQETGGVYPFQGWATLQRWVAEGRVGGRDEVARAGEGFRPIAAFPEFAAGVVRQPTPHGFTQPPPLGSRPLLPAAPSGWSAAPAVAQPAAAPLLALPPAGPPVWGAAGALPGWSPAAGQGGRAATPLGFSPGGSVPEAGRVGTPYPYRDGFGEFQGFDEYLEAVGLRRSRWLTIGLPVLLLLLLLGGLAFYLLLLRPGVAGDAGAIRPGSVAAVQPAPIPAAGPTAVRASSPLAGGPGASPGATLTPSPPTAPAAAPAVPPPAPVAGVAVPAVPPPAPVAGVAVPAAATPTPSPSVAASPPVVPTPAGAGPEAASPAAAAAPVAPPAPVAGYDGLMAAAYEHLLRERTGQALALYEKAAALRPTSAEPLTGVGWCHFNLGRPHIALLKFQRALQLNPAFGDALIGLGKAHQRLGQLERAKEAYQRYLREQPRGSKVSIARAALDQLAREAPAASPPAGN